eukprot:6189899-Pleurochrysis_carterae.AAC.3
MFFLWYAVDSRCCDMVIAVFAVGVPHHHQLPPYLDYYSMLVVSARVLMLSSLLPLRAATIRVSHAAQAATSAMAVSVPLKLMPPLG